MCFILPYSQYTLHKNVYASRALKFSPSGTDKIFLQRVHFVDTLRFIDKKKMQANTKINSNTPIEDLLDSVVDLHVKTGTDKIIKTVEKESRTQIEHIDTSVDRLVEGQNAVVDALNVVSDSADIKVGIAMDQMKKAQDKADRSERTAREVCGKLGSVERKRRQEDVDNMNRLRNELGVLKRQMLDKDRMVEELSDRVGTLVQQSRESNAKMDALMDLVRQLVDRRN